MTTLAAGVTDSTTMLRRNLKHAQRYPVLTLMVAGIPIVMLLLFVFVFGGTLGAGLGGLAGGRTEYVQFLTPGILVLAVASAAQGTAITVAMDMNEGIIARFRTMSVARASVLTGHVVGAVVQTMIGVTFVVAVALLVGFRPDAGAVEWLAAA
ncbi:MAG TPA: ABC transporter permease, partial [Blastococcus sp.]|nr:ABC transporter permease [Blastococcus sp.]